MILDVFQFFNELDILEIRLGTLYPIVDYFVIAEANVTHSGIPKPYYFELNKKRYTKYLDKIIYYKITDLPSTCKEVEQNTTSDELLKLCNKRILAGDWWPHEGYPAYVRDTAQKEFLLRALPKCNNEDILHLSDADEIPNPETFKKIIDTFDGNVYNLKQKNYIYSVDLRNGEPWLGGFIISYEKFRYDVGFCELKMKRRGIFVENGGWHFSFMGGHQKVLEKIQAYGEQALNIPSVTTNIKQNINRSIQSGKDLYGRNFGIWKEPISYETHPKYLVDNLEKFRNLYEPV